MSCFPWFSFTRLLGEDGRNEVFSPELSENILATFRAEINGERKVNRTANDWRSGAPCLELRKPEPPVGSSRRWRWSEREFFRLPQARVDHRCGRESFPIRFVNGGHGEPRDSSARVCV